MYFQICFLSPRVLIIYPMSKVNSKFFHWKPILAHKSIKYETYNVKSKGLFYRGYGQPIPQTQLFYPKKDLDISNLVNSGYKILNPITLDQDYSYFPTNSISRLSHGLEIVVNEPGVHFFDNQQNKKGKSYVKWLHPPSTIDYDRMAPFIISSKDNVRLN